MLCFCICVKETCEQDNIVYRFVTAGSSSPNLLLSLFILTVRMLFSASHSDHRRRYWVILSGRFGIAWPAALYPDCICWHTVSCKPQADSVCAASKIWLSNAPRSPADPSSLFPFEVLSVLRVFFSPAPRCFVLSLRLSNSDPEVILCWCLKLIFPQLSCDSGVMVEHPVEN